MIKYNKFNKYRLKGLKNTKKKQKKTVKNERITSKSTKRLLTLNGFQMSLPTTVKCAKMTKSNTKYANKQTQNNFSPGAKAYLHIQGIILFAGNDHSFRQKSPVLCCLSPPPGTLHTCCGVPFPLRSGVASA